LHYNNWHGPRRMEGNNCRRVLITCRNISREDLPVVLEAVSSIFNVESVVIRFHHGPVSFPFPSLPFKSVPVHPSYSLSGGKVRKGGST